MKNLDQIRAHNALQHKDRIASSQGDGDAISGFPMLVLADGLLAALAFACEEKEMKREKLPAENIRQAMIQAGLLRRTGQGQQEQWFGRKHEGEYTVARAIAEHLNAATGGMGQAHVHHVTDDIAAFLGRLVAGAE